MPRGQVTDFYRAAHARDDEAVVFAWLEWPDKATRQAAHAAMMADERLMAMGAAMPFDAKRMIFGGFTIVSDH